MNIGTGSAVESSGELYVLRHVSRQLVSQRRLVVFDVGANVGTWTVAAARIFPSTTAFHCFEPSAETSSVLLRNIAGVPSAKVHQIGVGENSQRSILFRPSQSSVASLYQRATLHFDTSTPTETISVRRIDEVCAEFGISAIDFLKLDIEGHELAALRGCGDFIRDRIAFIQFEFGGCNIDSRTYFRDFWELLSPEFRLYRVLPKGLAELTTYNERLEQFTTTNFLAVSRRFS